MKKIRYFLEYVALRVVLFLLDWVGAENASNIAGKIGRLVGPRLPASKRALAHLQMALPGKEKDEYAAIIEGMWNHLVRMIAEYPNLDSFPADIEMVGVDHIKTALEQSGQAIVISGHIGNWELMAATLAFYDIPIDLLYRAPNNPYVDKLLNKYRSLNGKLTTIPKSRAGTRLLVERLKEGNSAGLLIDQKYNEGIEAPFFGHPAMTSTAFVQLGQKLNIPVVPFRVERLDGTARFRLSFFEPLKLFETDGTTPRPHESVIAEAHALLESWIRERPEQWLWTYNVLGIY
jgi:KDO2-lipid IV(A) lauroyltransferase